MTPLYILGGTIVLLLGVVLWKQFQKTETIPAADLQLKERMGELQNQLETEKSERNKLVGVHKQVLAELQETKSDIRASKKEVELLQREVARFEAQEKERTRELNTQMKQLEISTKSLEEQKLQLIRENEEERRHEEEERDRIWAEHENAVIARLTSLCKSPQFAFEHFTNTNLPEDFDGSLKPDFMIGFLDQYIIFDAKKSKQESLQTYINDTMKKTVTKVKKNPKIAPMIFLVVPTMALSELKSFNYSVDGYSVYVVAPESLPPILASLKRITTYEFADQMDPQVRENIIQLIAEYDFHINLRNAADLILTKQGIQIIEKAQKIDPEIAGEVALKKQPMNAKASIAAAELKKIVSNLTGQDVEVQQLVSPKTSVQKRDLKAAELLLSETLP
jgi:TolA-binding protein